MNKKENFILFISFFYFFLNCNSYANIQERLLNNFKELETFSFNFTQKIGKKVELGECYIKYPLLMKCEYNKKKKSIIADGKKFAIVNWKDKKIYSYQLKKTPLFFLLDKENILNLIKNYKPTLINSDVIEYIFVEKNLNEFTIFFDKKSLDLSGWRTIDAYSNEVNFFIKDVKKNIWIDEKIFEIPKEKDL